VNDEIGHYFQTRKGLRQGNPFSSILFNLVADMLAILINRTKEDGQVEGLIPVAELGPNFCVLGGGGGKNCASDRF
jgi:hypothetical protein